MSLARVATRCRQGISASTVWVEAHLSPGLPTIALVGMSATVVKDAKERVRSAIISSGYRWPDARLTISFSPAGVHQAAASLDLPIAVAILIASRQSPRAWPMRLNFMASSAWMGGSWRQVAYWPPGQADVTRLQRSLHPVRMLLS